ncbi:MAG: bifunctional 5,10-methylenetetrahydrofolate dehydrogenase/5,10-methenyltetrahydrofolate cyclohydrolase [Planctomycetota bacterium]
MAQIIDGKAIADAIKGEVMLGVAALGGKPPCVVAVQVGEDSSSAAYVRSQARQAQKVGILHRLDQLPATASETELREKLITLNADPDVHAVMLQMPLPRGLDGRRARSWISAEKDVEAVTETAAGRLVAGTHTTAPCTALAAMSCLVSAAKDLSGLDVAVVGRSEIVGRPLGLLLLHANATVTLCHSRTKNLGAKLKAVDAVIVAVGKPGLITADMVREDAIVIDVGTNWVEDASEKKGGHLVGDVAFEEVSQKVAQITPVPGGVGPVTVAILLRNVLELARKQRQ